MCGLIVPERERDVTGAATGVEALARALEHVHLGWTLLGFLLRLPVVAQLAQLLVDASGGEPRRIAHVCGAKAFLRRPSG